MSLKSFIVPRAAQKLLGEDRLNKQRKKFERGRMSNSEAHKVEFFHDPSDPYSQLLEKVLPRFAKNYKIELITHLVSPPDDAAAPERAKLTEYSKMDAMRLAKKAGIEFEIQDRPPAQNTSVADALREKLGHYLGATLYYGGEWYWGLDRLHYLESRLTQLGARKEGAGGPIYEPPQSPWVLVIRERNSIGMSLSARLIRPLCATVLKSSLRLMEPN